MIADAIYGATLRPRREYWIGQSTTLAILANIMLPGLLDRVLARKAYDGQMTKKPVLPQRRDNLIAPVHDLHRAHGSFDREAGHHALLLQGPVVRITAGLVGATLAFFAGALVQRFVFSRKPKAWRRR